MSGYFLIFEILSTLIWLILLLYLAYIILNPDRRKLALAKHKKSASDYKLYRKVYSARFLAAWTCLTASFIFDTAYDAYRATRHVSLLVVYSELLISALLLTAGGYLLLTLFRKK